MMQFYSSKATGKVASDEDMLNKNIFLIFFYIVQ